MMLDYVLRLQKMPAKDFFAAVGGSLLLANGMACAVTLHNAHAQHGLAYLVLALGGAWIADTGAYFTGTFFGKTKLCPAVSPKKTLEGFVGGIIAIVQLAVYLTVNLGIMNLLPIPALDGGNLLLYFAEAVKGKPLNRQTQAYIRTAGIIFLIAVMAYALFGDIARII
jgi:CDP-diglyceride synthetase